MKIVNFLTRNSQPTTHLSTQDHMTIEQISHKSCVKTNENGTNLQAKFDISDNTFDTYIKVKLPLR